MDAFIAGITYSRKEIAFTWLLVGVIGLVTVVDTAAAMIGVVLLRKAMAPQGMVWLAAVLLIALGGYRMLVEYLAGNQVSRVVRVVAKRRSLAISIGQLFITVTAKPEVADSFGARHVGLAQALLLGVALSVDNMVAASALSLDGRVPAYTPIIMGTVQVAFFAAGCYGLAFLISDRLKCCLPYAAAVVLMILGLVRLL